MIPAPSFRFASAHLRVASLERSEAFYVGVLGLHSERSSRGELTLHPAPGSPALLILREILGLLRAPEHTPGLFHLALLVPARADLARIARRLAAQHTLLQGLSDHGVSEAIYLADPDGLGIELYADRPRPEWPRENGKLTMFTRRLDVPHLLAAAPDDLAAGLPSGTTLGHIHLRVSSLSAAERFATAQLHLDVVTRDYPGAIFFSAEGYHHHLATNTWGVNDQPATAPHAGLDSVQISIRDLSAPRTIDGPAGIRFDLHAASASQT